MIGSRPQWLALLIVLIAGSLLLFRTLFTKPHHHEISAFVLPRDVRSLLEELGLVDYAAEFATEHIRLADIPLLNERQIEKLVPHVGPQARLLRWIESHRGTDRIDVDALKSRVATLENKLVVCNQTAVLAQQQNAALHRPSQSNPESASVDCVRTSFPASLSAMEVWSPVSTRVTKVRLGKDNDGGYVICDIPGLRYDALFAAGIANEDSFERAFLSRYPSLIGFAFDGWIHALPRPHKRLFFQKINIAGTESDTDTTALDLIRTHDNWFFKIDIESHEYHWFDAFCDSELLRIAQLTIEIHALQGEAQWATMTRLANTHYLVHVHANNHGAGLEFKVFGTLIPHALELTYVRKDLLPDGVVPNSLPIPTPVDQPNKPEEQDISLVRYPWVWTLEDRPAVPIPIHG